ncbi:hypothetical protein D3C78_1960500 [compost metagenome]
MAFWVSLFFSWISNSLPMRLRSRSALGMWNSRCSFFSLSLASVGTKVGEVKMNSRESMLSSSFFSAT